MLYSMTGFGRGERSEGNLRARIEIRSVNHRNLDVRLYVPSYLNQWEPEILRFLRERVGRGRLEVRCEVDGLGRGGAVLDVAGAEQVYRRLRGLSSHLGLGLEISLSDVLTAPGLWDTAEPDADESVYQVVVAAMEDAVDALASSRLREGKALQADLLGHLDRFSALLEDARARAPERVEEYRVRLEERIAVLSEGTDVDPQRIAAEVALFADRADVAEEIARADAHIAGLRTLVESERGPSDRVGKRADFFLQELNRETNTMGSKSRDETLTRLTIEMKSALESMREQAANVQ